jgi:hypothetical protein
MKSVSGCYSINKNTISVTQAEKEPSEMTYKVTGGMLTLKGSEREYSYNFVQEGTWYQSKEIDYQKPSGKPPNQPIKPTR